MPSIQEKLPIEDHTYKYPSLNYIIFHFPVVTLQQLKDDINISSFNSISSEKSLIFNQLQQKIYPKIEIDKFTILYKRQLREDLLKQNTTFDEYRQGTNIELDTINERFELPGYKKIFIHECDFIDYKSEILSKLTSELHEELPYFYKHYNSDELICKFSNFIHFFKIDLELSMKYNLEIDSRMKYCNIFSHDRLFPEIFYDTSYS